MLHNPENRTMSTMRTVSREQRENRQALESILISLCTRLEQRMVKGNIFCKQVSFFIKYKDATSWDTAVKLADPVQDAMELRSYIQERINDFVRSRNLETIFTSKVLSMGIAIQQFVKGDVLQYSLFDNKIKKDIVRKTMYNIKDRYGKNTVRKGSELFNPHVVHVAIGFGSVRDMGLGKDGEIRNKYLLEEDDY